MHSELPDSLQIELHDLYMAVAQARIDGNSLLEAQRYQEFERFCREQTAKTGSPTFFCGLAVITDDDATAIQLFHEAFRLAQMRDESAQDILYPLAIRHFQRDEFELAKKYALESHSEAMAAGDEEARAEAEILLEQISAQYG